MVDVTPKILYMNPTQTIQKTWRRVTFKNCIIYSRSGKVRYSVLQHTNHEKIEWCRDNCIGKWSYIVLTESDSMIFYFKTSQDKVSFALAWQ